MALVVHAMGAYASYSSSEIEWRRDDYDINKLVKSLKGEQVKGYAKLRGADRVLRHITNGDRDPALQYFAAWAERLLGSLDLGRIVLVPIPSSSCTSYRHGGAPFDMANAIQARMGRQVKVERWLRFVEEMTPSHDGGTRSVDVLMDAMRVARAEMSGAQVVLVDDVKTTGAHCKASARKLRAFGANVEMAVVAASTVWARHPHPFNVASEDIEEDAF